MRAISAKPATLITVGLSLPNPVPLLSVTGLPWGSDPVAVAELLTLELSISPCVSVYTALNVALSDAPGLKLAIGPPLTLIKGSLMVIPVTVTFPTFVTVNE